MDIYNSRFHIYKKFGITIQKGFMLGCVGWIPPPAAWPSCEDHLQALGKLEVENSTSGVNRESVDFGKPWVLSRNPGYQAATGKNHRFGRLGYIYIYIIEFQTTLSTCYFSRIGMQYYAV